jgi:magnesium-dependent phosphatase 1
MGVTSILVGNGVNLGALRQGLAEFSQKSGSSSRGKQN